MFNLFNTTTETFESIVADISKKINSLYMLAASKRSAADAVAENISSMEAAIIALDTQKRGFLREANTAETVAQKFQQLIDPSIARLGDDLSEGPEFEDGPDEEGFSGNHPFNNYGGT